ncbi:hypothetical protein L2E82_50135 [Cichorium intybus]|nr:hypothetical protein L2E82_50135 [Cichorium intybus]
MGEIVRGLNGGEYGGGGGGENGREGGWRWISCCKTASFLTKIIDLRLIHSVPPPLLIVCDSRSYLRSELVYLQRRSSETLRTTADTIDKWLAEGVAGIQHNAFYMHRALRSPKILGTVAVRAQTSRLSPHKYYELYMRAFDELRKLETFFKEEEKHVCSVVDLYELVQHAGNILPRLYLLCTVGSVYIKSKEAPAKDVLKDLVEMCRAVQHPIRGLYLRSYLAQINRDKLPDIGSEYEGNDDTVMDAVEFVLQYFSEMNCYLRCIMAKISTGGAVKKALFDFAYY